MAAGDDEDAFDTGEGNERAARDGDAVGIGVDGDDAFGEGTGAKDAIFVGDFAFDGERAVLSVDGGADADDFTGASDGIAFEFDFDALAGLDADGEAFGDFEA